jgi:asparagine synthase (glutamine-hydrolysing)
MCGLVGIVDLSGRTVDRALLRRMADTIAHRGPDEEGDYVSGGVGLHHKRLSIIDLATGQQPMTRRDVTVVFNGEIYNFVELRAQLKARGHSFETTSDTEVLLEAYLEWGEACVEHLNGMFGFVVHDAGRKRIFAARDHFGIKPLYYWRGGGRVLFASEIKALLVHPGVAAQVDPVGLSDYLTFQYVLGEETLFKDIHKLQPAHSLTLDLASGQMRQQRFWDLRFEVDRSLDAPTAIERLRGLLDDAVRQQMRSDVPVGTYLSGGLDSSTVTMLAARHTTERLSTFTGAFREGQQFDETRYATAVAEAIDAHQHLVYPTADEFADLIPKIVYHMDEPAAGPGLFPQYIVSRLASQHVKVCLGGQGGDEVFGGYARYSVAYLEQALKARVLGNKDEGDLAVDLEDIGGSLITLREYAPMLQRLWQEDLFGSIDRRYFRLSDRSDGALQCFSAEFTARFDRSQPFARFQRVFNRIDSPSYFNRMLHYDLTASLPALLQVEDRVSMASSLESRVPLLDKRIFEFVGSVSPTIRFRNGELRHFFRQAAKSIVPTAVFERTDKMGFPVPLHLWAKGRVRDFFRDVLLSRACRERGLFDMARVEALIQQEAAFGRALWGLLQLELWHQQFIDGAKRA